MGELQIPILNICHITLVASEYRYFIASGDLLSRIEVRKAYYLYGGQIKLTENSFVGQACRSGLRRVLGIVPLAGQNVY